MFATLNERPPPLLTPHPGARGVPAEGSRSAATVREEDGAVVPKKLLPAVYQTQRFVTHFFDEARLSKNRSLEYSLAYRHISYSIPSYSSRILPYGFIKLGETAGSPTGGAAAGGLGGAGGL